MRFSTRLFTYFTLIALMFVSWAPSRAAESIDDPAYWKPAQEALARLGHGFVVWESVRTNAWRIWTINLDGTGLRQLSPEEPGHAQLCPKIAPGGKRLIYVSFPNTVSSDKNADDLDRADTYSDLGALHIINSDGTGDRVVVAKVRKYNGWDRAVTWFDDHSLAYIGEDFNTYRIDVDTGKSELLIPGAGCWLPNTTLTHVVQSFNTFSLLDPARKVTTMPHLGGCQCYFTQDGKWGFWMKAMGGPIYKMQLSTRVISPIIDGSKLPHPRNYLYYPMVSVDQRYLAFGAADHTKLIGAYGGYLKSDYDIFIVPIDPDTLTPTGNPVRYSFDPHCDRFPDVYQTPPPLGRQKGKAPFTVVFNTGKQKGNWKWTYGDGATEERPLGKHTYIAPGSYLVEARLGGVVLCGQVQVSPADPPQVTGSSIENEREVVVSFDQPVDTHALSLKLKSGATIAKWAMDDDRCTLRVTLDEKPKQPDVLMVSGAQDFAQHPNKMIPAFLDITPPVWPVNARGLVFLWQNARAANRVRDPISGTSSAYNNFEMDYNVRLDGRFGLDLQGGQARVLDFGGQFSQAVRKSNAFSMEITVTPRSSMDARGGCIISYGLSQVDDKLVLTVGGVSTILCTLPVGQASHVIVTYKPGELICYLNGKLAFTSNKVNATLLAFPDGALVFGNDLDQHAWYGNIDGVALFNRVLSADEATAEDKAYRGLRDAVKIPDLMVVTGKLISASRVPELKEIAPYRSAMVVNEYAVDPKQSDPRCPLRIRVAHWALLNGQTNPIARAPVGVIVRMSLYPLASQPQLDGQYTADTLDLDADVPQFYAAEESFDWPYSPRWTGISGFPISANDGIDRAFSLEGKIGLPAAFPAPAGQEWRVLHTQSNHVVDMFKLMPKIYPGFGYAVTYVKCPAERKARLLAGTVGPMEVWLNGEMVVSGDFGSYPFLGYRQEMVDLKAGWNEILVKEIQRYGFWCFSLDLLNVDGKAMTDLDYNLTPE